MPVFIEKGIFTDDKETKILRGNVLIRVVFERFKFVVALALELFD